MTSVALIGHGYFGKIHAKDLEELGVLAHIVTRSGGDGVIKADVTEEVPSELVEVDAWDVTTNTHTHYPIVRKALEEGKDVFIEKPPTETLQQLDHLLQIREGSKVGVDYIELAHPVVLAVRDDLDFRVGTAVHRRSKDLRGEIERGIGGGEGSRVTLEDLIHDIAEVGSWADLAEAEVTEADIRTWEELYGEEHPHSTDVRSHFRLNFGNAEAEIYGAFDSPEVRQFVWINEGGDEALFGNTLSRESIEPVAARISGSEAVDSLKEKILEGEMITGEKIEGTLEEMDAEILREGMDEHVPESKHRDGQPVYGHAPLYNMLQNFLSDEPLICPLEDAREVQEIAESVYGKADRLEAMGIPAGI